MQFLSIRKTPEVPAYAATQEDDSRWTSRGKISMVTMVIKKTTKVGDRLPSETID